MSDIKSTVLDEVKESHIIRDFFVGIKNNWKNVLLISVFMLLSFFFGYLIGETELTEDPAEETAIEEVEE